MKKRTFIIFFFVCLLLFNTVYAKKGIGLVTQTESLAIDEMSQKCISYGVFNPWDEDVSAYLDIKGGINEIITKKETKPQLIKAQTPYQEANNIELCFSVGEIYVKKCILGLACYQPCDQEPVIYEGEIIAVEAREEATTTGSATSLGIASPLTVTINCQSTERNWTQVYVILIIIALFAIGILLYKKYKK